MARILPRATLFMLAIGATIAFALWLNTLIVAERVAVIASGYGVVRILAVLCNVLIGIVLLVLMFVSNRRGFDDDLARRVDIPPKS